VRRICFMCKEPHTRLAKLCATCVKVKAAHSKEVMRQESRLMLRGWLPSGMATARGAVGSIFVNTSPHTTEANQ